MKEKRAHFRIPLKHKHVPITTYTEKGLYSGLLQDLSKGGVGFVSREPIEGTTITVYYTYQNQFYRELVEVKSIIKIKDGYRIGCAFTGIPSVLKNQSLDWTPHPSAMSAFAM
ncbi:PilZ domain-containing protein (plasmid) [Pontibacillus sp. ALD_SL1]|uniref:PilZ domain-containing protein n=1 Tax=Pontibacillus sp. ALD_SL1 TaxID=2777185 RepID=UPI001A9593AF|nr:PilZ domain-containing protein [Pontibacillus sp. ALD_SL1]QST02084.1 PilZ domain-containing protein [Pontibacillus sp. ALD_SL1]